MREILFKAKTWRGKWVQGDLIQLQSTTCIHSYENFMRVSEEVDPNTICQFTGLTDKNGKRIWENDIVKCESDYLGEKTTYTGMVFFREDTCTFLVTSGESVDYEWWCEKKEVIGNSFDNPELLERVRNE